LAAIGITAITGIVTIVTIIESSFVMAGLNPAIHVFLVRQQEDVDARHKAGHDERFESVLRSVSKTNDVQTVTRQFFSR
jgi:hypothetical protein